MSGAAYHRGESKQDYATPPEFIAAVKRRFSIDQGRRGPRWMRGFAWRVRFVQSQLPPQAACLKQFLFPPGIGAIGSARTFRSMYSAWSGIAATVFLMALCRR